MLSFHPNPKTAEESFFVCKQTLLLLVHQNASQKHSFLTDESFSFFTQTRWDMGSTYGLMVSTYK